MNVSITASAIQNNYARDLNDLHIDYSFIHYIMAIKLHFQAKQFTSPCTLNAWIKCQWNVRTTATGQARSRNPNSHDHSVHLFYSV